MKRHRINELFNFISGWYMDDTKLCDDILDYHKNSDKKSAGIFGNDKEKNLIDKSIKDSTDVVLLHDQLLYERYIDHLRDTIHHYCEQYPKAGDYGYFANDKLINVQHYAPGGGYHGWHTERNSHLEPVCYRHLVFMTYLNDVDDRGETEFWHQQIKIKPEKGLTLMWPADWTFTHRGVSSPTQEKYIVTGWLNYIANPNQGT